MNYSLNLYRKHGLRTWFGMVHRMAYRQLTGQPASINSGTAISFWATAEDFIAIAEAAGLLHVRTWQCWHYPTRNNYLFRKAE